jgi:hypothetical protein
VTTLILVLLIAATRDGTILLQTYDQLWKLGDRD